MCSVHGQLAFSSILNHSLTVEVITREFFLLYSLDWNEPQQFRCFPSDWTEIKVALR